MFDVVFDGMLLEFFPFLYLQPAAEHKLIIALTRGDKLEVGGWWIYGGRKLICQCRQSQASYWHDRQTDSFSALYIYRLALVTVLRGGSSLQVYNPNAVLIICMPDLG